MTTQEKAKELLKKVDDCVCGDINERNAKDMAILICDEIINLSFLYNGRDHEIKDEAQRWYWEEVKEKIED